MASGISGQWARAKRLPERRPKPLRRKISPRPIPPPIRILAVCPECGQSFGSQYGWVTCPECKTGFAHFREEQKEWQPADRPSLLSPAGLAVLLLFLQAGFWTMVSRAFDLRYAVHPVHGVMRRSHGEWDL